MENGKIGLIKGVVDFGGIGLDISLVTDSGLFGGLDVKKAVVESIEEILGKKLPYGIAHLSGINEFSFYVKEMNKHNFH